MTDSSEEDKGKPEDPEEVKGRLYPPTETPALISLKLQVLPVTSSQGITGTSVLELDISSAEALTPPYAASVTQQQDEESICEQKLPATGSADSYCRLVA